MRWLVLLSLVALSGCSVSIRSKGLSESEKTEKRMEQVCNGSCSGTAGSEFTILRDNVTGREFLAVFAGTMDGGVHVVEIAKKDDVKAEEPVTKVAGFAKE
jgi:hypothetical protein